jgi:hypothetical protein
MLVAPGSVNARFRGYGWIAIDTHDGAAAGHFSETPRYVGPNPRNTFDPEYTQLQLERMIGLWLLTRDSRALAYAASLHRRLLPLVDPASWQLDSRQGSRTSHLAPFHNPGTCVLALHAPDAAIDLDFALA